MVHAMYLNCSKAFYTVSHKHPCNEAQELWDRQADSEMDAELLSGRAQRAAIGGTECSQRL